MSALDDRWQRAREAGLDAYAGALATPSDPERAAQAIDDAIEAATRVRISGEIIAAGADADSGNSYGADYEAIIKAAFEAAGFEVEA